MGEHDILYIIIPAYNEEDNIKSCIEQWYEVVQKHDGNGLSRLVIIDDGSRDSTYSLIMEEVRKRPLLTGLTKKNGGHGSTVLYGYRYAIDHNADFIFQTDSDGQTDPGEFEQFWKNRESFDAVIGNRVKRGDGKSRKFVEDTVCFLLKTVFGIRVEDANAPFRLMKTSIVDKYINKLPADFNIPNIMFTTYFVYYGEKVKFLPISFKPRLKGNNSINIRKIVKIGYKALGDFYRLRRDM